MRTIPVIYSDGRRGRARELFRESGRLYADPREYRLLSGETVHIDMGAIYDEWSEREWRAVTQPFLFVAAVLAVFGLLMLLAGQ